MFCCSQANLHIRDDPNCSIDSLPDSRSQEYDPFLCCTHDKEKTYLDITHTRMFTLLTHPPSGRQDLLDVVQYGRPDRRIPHYHFRRARFDIVVQGVQLSDDICKVDMASTRLDIGSCFA